MEIKIPARFSDNFGESFNYLIEWLIQLNSEEPNELCIDFSESKFVSPFIIGSIAAISGRQNARGKKVVYKLNNSVNSYSYFDAICFPSGFNFTGLNSEEMNNKLDGYSLKTFIPLVLLPTSSSHEDSALRENALSAINSILKQQLKLKGNILEAIYYLIDELTNNISDHSRSDLGILFAQFYPTKNYMDVCIADFGRGIMQTYLESGKANPVTHDEALLFAINGQSTKDQAISRGYGISTSRKMLTEGLKGKFMLYSGNAMFYQNSEKQEIIALPEMADFHGCLVALRIPTLPNNLFDFYKFTQ